MNKSKKRFLIKGDVNIALMKELIDEFLSPEDYEVDQDLGLSHDVVINEILSSDRDTVKRELYNKLVDLTGRRQEWGALTGVRPVKLAGELIEDIGESKARERLSSFYYLSDRKIDSLVSMYNYQKSLFGTAPSGSNEIYVGIPFCPTRCLYCSFASYQVGEDEINKYFDVLQEEISHCGKRMNDCSLTSESCYIGGGTPTTLAPGQLEELLLLIKDNFPGIKELTVEAGRPDTITKDKLDVLSDMGVDRISINPQSMKAETLERIGRSHTPQDIVDAFELANGYEFDSVNCDIIAGLPGEKVHDLENTLDAVIGLGADNITVHTLSVKRGSRLHEADKEYHYKASDIVKEMLELADAKLCDNGYKPYYLYRQKHMAGAMENTGYCRDDKACLYNVRVMDEHQSTLALGAGGISKKYYPDINRLVRVPNVSNYVDYIERIDEMIDRKEKEFFVEDKNAD